MIQRMTSVPVLVEGHSDAVVLDVLGRRLGYHDGRVEVVVMGGITNVRTHLERLNGARVAGLYDRSEERYLLRTLERLGRDAEGFFGCDADLEDELIRALGTDRVVEVIDQEGELALLETFQQQPFQRGRSLHDQLHRFCGTKSGRKARLAAALAEAMPLDRIPAPIAGVLTFTSAGGR